MSKVAQARNKGIPLITVEDLKQVLEGSTTLDQVEPMGQITEFSKGYDGNSLALTASEHELAVSSGTAAPMLEENKKSATKKTTGAGPVKKKQRKMLANKN
jgi:hypothetical protein